MKSNLNSEISHELTAAIDRSAFNEFAMLRYDEGDPGYACYIDHLELVKRDLGAIPTDFLVFRNCVLSGASYSGKRFFPLSLWSCQADGLDLRNTTGMFFAYATDLRGVKFDETTELVSKEADLPSAFKDCLMDADFANFIIQQGALLDFPPGLNIESYAFGVRPEDLIPSRPII